MVTTRLTSSDIPGLVNILRSDPFLLGFDQVFDRLVSSGIGSASTATYPPYNIVKNGEDTFAIEIALAGFAEEEIDVSVKEDTLTVESLKDHSASGGGDTYIHQGIAERNFKRVWTLSPTIIVAGASFENGLLSINLKNEIPEDKRARKIKIKKGAWVPPTGDPQILNES